MPNVSKHSFYMHFFILHAFFYVFERENVYFPDPNGVSRTNLLKSLLHVIETNCMVNCAGTFRSKNPGLIRKQCKAGPFEIRQQRSCLAHLSVKKNIIFACLQDIYSICLVFELHLSSFILSANASLSYLS